MLKEHQQLNYGPMTGKPVFGPISNEELSGEDRKKALKAVNLIKGKQCGSIKGIIGVNGSLYKIYLKEDDYVYSPTYLTESLMSTLFIDAM